MVNIKEVEINNTALRIEVVKSQGSIAGVLRAKILAHVEIVKKELSLRIDSISDMADNPSVWKAKKDSLLPKLQKERKQLVDMLSGWESLGF